MELVLISLSFFKCSVIAKFRKYILQSFIEECRLGELLCFGVEAFLLTHGHSSRLLLLQRPKTALVIGEAGDGEIGFVTLGYGVEL